MIFVLIDRDVVTTGHYKEVICSPFNGSNCNGLWVLEGYSFIANLFKCDISYCGTSHGPSVSAELHVRFFIWIL